MIRGFVELYKQNYLQKGNLIPIFAEAREATSYRVIEALLKRYGRDLGIDFVLEEVDKEVKGKDTMHRILIRPVKVGEEQKLS